MPVNMTYQWHDELLKFSGTILEHKDIFIVKKVGYSLCNTVGAVAYWVLSEIANFLF